MALIAFYDAKVYDINSPNEISCRCGKQKNIYKKWGVLSKKCSMTNV